MKYNFRKTEKKWQKKWEKEKIFQVKEGKKKFYCLEMFPYPSASGLHMGHAFNYTIGDICARFKRMQGFNVLYPMGFDSFGLPAENAAIEAKKNPKIFTESAIKNYIKQMKGLGLSYDWDRMIKTSDPDYYKWNQFFFLKFLEKGLVYRKNSPVNWCPKCNTVLANEQVHNGRCWRHPDIEVEIKQLEQWFIKTTAYIEELLDFIDDLEWPEKIKLMQKNWIGKSEGVTEVWDIDGMDLKLETFTTWPHTTFGCTFMVIAPEHPLVEELVKETKYEKEVSDFVRKFKKERIKTREELDKAGVFTGKYVINYATGEKMPLYVANFVVMDYGSGIVKCCPAHDQRDFEFAVKYSIPIKVVIEPKDYNIYERNGQLPRAYHGEGFMVNAGNFTGLSTKDAHRKFTDWAIKKKRARKEIQYKMRDWLISRQRYWGTPIPIIYCDKCGIQAVPEKDIPVLLPEKVRFGKGNPLKTNKNFIEVKCPKCGGKAKRETDTMDTFFDSSWYYLRYCDNKNKKEAFDKKKVEYWMPVDQYIGGAEHATMHLIYARFFTKALRDLGFLNIDEPFTKLFNQGMLHGEDGEKMSKSREKYAILPETVSKKYGMDTARLFLVSIASPDKDIQWSEKGIEGSLRFVKRLINYFSKISFGVKSEKIVEHKINKTIKELSDHIENFQYNLGVIKIRTLFDSIQDRQVSKKDLENFVKLLAPFIPHLAEEFWEKLGNKKLIVFEKWPIADEKKINSTLDREEEMKDKLVSDINHIKKLTGKEKVKVYVYVLPNELDIYKRVEGVKVFAVNNKNKYDPENKSKKAKLGKPGIYLE